MIKSKEYFIALIIYGIAFIYAIIIAPKIGYCKTSLCNIINNIHETCLVYSNNTNITKYRGDNYYIGITDKEKKEKLDNCLITWWGGTHFLLYCILGYTVPTLFWETFTLGCLFEVYEYKKYQCHDALDIILNTAGFLLGRYVKINK